MLIKKPFKKGFGFSGAPYYKASGGGGVSTTFNGSFKGADIALSGGNLVATYSTSGVFEIVGSTVTKTTGKFYCEAVLTGSTTNPLFGFANSSANLSGLLGGGDNNSLGWVSDSRVFLNGGAVNIQTYAAGDTCCMAVDVGGKLVWFRTNGGNWNNAAIGSQDPAGGVGGISFSTMNMGTGIFPAGCFFTTGQVWTINFGNTAYAQSAPSGFGNWV